MILKSIFFICIFISCSIECLKLLQGNAIARPDDIGVSLTNTNLYLTVSSVWDTNELRSVVHREYHVELYEDNQTFPFHFQYQYPESALGQNEGSKIYLNITARITNITDFRVMYVTNETIQLPANYNQVYNISLKFVRFTDQSKNKILKYSRFYLMICICFFKSWTQVDAFYHQSRVCVKRICQATFTMQLVRTVNYSYMEDVAVT